MKPSNGLHQRSSQLSIFQNQLNVLDPMSPKLFLSPKSNKCPTLHDNHLFSNGEADLGESKGVLSTRMSLADHLCPSFEPELLEIRPAHTENKQENSGLTSFKSHSSQNQSRVLLIDCSSCIFTPMAMKRLEHMLKRAHCQVEIEEWSENSSFVVCRFDIVIVGGASESHELQQSLFRKLHFAATSLKDECANLNIPRIAFIDENQVNSRTLGFIKNCGYNDVLKNTCSFEEVKECLIKCKKYSVSHETRSLARTNFRLPVQLPPINVMLAKKTDSKEQYSEQIHITTHCSAKDLVEESFSRGAIEDCVSASEDSHSENSDNLDALKELVLKMNQFIAPSIHKSGFCPGTATPNESTDEMQETTETVPVSVTKQIFGGKNHQKNIWVVRLDHAS